MMYPERKPAEPQPAPAATPAAVEIRRYRSIEDFQVDAASMAAANWQVIAQSEATGGASGAWMALAAISFIGGLLFFIPLLLVAIVAVLIALASRRKELVVTYRPEAGFQPTSQPPIGWGPTSQAPPGSVCGRCGKPLSPIWQGRCEHCKTPYAEAPPIPAAG